MWLGFAVGMVASNALEWAVHKYVLHGLGKKKGTYWSFHWHEHHRNVKKNGMLEPMYEEPLHRAPSKVKELVGIVSGAAMATPLLPVAPGFVLAGWVSAGAYYYVHKKSHLDPEWATKWVPWHVDHHLGPDQEKNLCVTWPLWDWVMGTRVPYVGTPEQIARDAAREEKRKKREQRAAEAAAEATSEAAEQELPTVAFDAPSGAEAVALAG